MTLTYRKRSFKFRDALGIATDASTSRRGEEWAANRDGSLSPESIAKVCSYDTPSDAVLTTLFVVVPLPC
jgi:hypothetical protein